jgi:hypothetical protein
VNRRKRRRAETGLYKRRRPVIDNEKRRTASQKFASPFFEWRLLKRFLPFIESESPWFSLRKCLAVGMLTPSRAESPPNVLVGLDMLEFKSFSAASEFAVFCEKA